MEDLEYKFMQALAIFNGEHDGLKKEIVKYKEMIPFLNADLIVGMILQMTLQEGKPINAEMCELLRNTARNALKE
ncbi:TPA: hypothetical protein N3Z77_004702 [Salmonella enterica subsp. enterica serovar 14:z:e,n,x]|nr:hypothetical protein [Salmonella enterica subsp. enterica serovar 14:z:e,n,x]